MYFGGRREGTNESWISLYHPDTGVVEYLTKAPVDRHAQFVGYDPSLQRTYMGCGGGGDQTFEYINIIPEPTTLSLLTLGGLALIRRRHWL